MAEPTFDWNRTGLSGDKRDAARALAALFEAYGLGSLAPAIVNYIQQGYSADTVTLLLQDSPEYKARFKGNEARQKAGLPVLSPSEYLSVESAYREVMSNAGVPRGFYDQPSDFEKWITDDVSPTEIKQRVDAAQQMIQSADQGALAAFRKFYSEGDLIAYALDPTRAAPLVGKQFEAAKIAGAAADQGLAVGRELSENLAANGVSRDQARQGFGVIADEKDRANKLADISGTSGFTIADLANEVFLADAEVAERRQRLASQERARFSGGSGVGGSSLSTSGSGSL
jgi:hypothetical protein